MKVFLIRLVKQMEFIKQLLKLNEIVSMCSFFGFVMWDDFISHGSSYIWFYIYALKVHVVSVFFYFFNNTCFIDVEEFRAQ